MSISLVPVVLSPSELEIIAVAARLEGSSISEFIARYSLNEALATCKHPPRDLLARGQPHKRFLPCRQVSRKL